VKQGLEKSAGLDSTQLAQIEALATVVNQADGLSMKLNWSRLRHRPAEEVNDFLYYVDDVLVGFLALYIFNTQEAEVSAMTHPAHRRRGIFTRLLTAARPEVRRRRVPDLLFICERASTAGRASMETLPAVYQYSEYRMDLTRTLPPLALPAYLHLRPATLPDVPLMAHLDEICFRVPAEFNVPRLTKELSTVDHKTAFIVEFEGQGIGKIHIIANGPETWIAGFAILPAHRRQGYGKIILSQTIANLKAQGVENITLEVETKNENALTLYQHCGFETVTGYDYYRLPACNTAPGSHRAGLFFPESVV
jgi:GNAT superfamily N-acetyltransferase